MPDFTSTLVAAKIPKSSLGTYVSVDRNILNDLLKVTHLLGSRTENQTSFWLHDPRTFHQP